MGKIRFGYYERQFRAIRQEWSRNCPRRKAVLVADKCKIEGLDKYLCACCSGFYAYSDVQVDHVYPIGNTKPQNYEDFIACVHLLHSDKLQVLCKPCHKAKTKIELQEKAKEMWANIIATHMHIDSDFVLRQLEDHAVLKKIGMIVKKLVKAEGFKHAMYTDKLEKNIKKYF